MLEKIRILTSCVSPGGGGHVVLWKGIKKHTDINAAYYMNDRKRSEHLRPVLVQEVEDMLYYGRNIQILMQRTT